MHLNTVQEIERAIVALTPQQRDELYSWFEENYSRPGSRLGNDKTDDPSSVVAAMRALRARLKPDPEGWTTRDYVNFGRH